LPPYTTIGRDNDLDRIAAGEQHETGPCGGDPVQVVVAQVPGGLVLDHRAGAESGLARRHRGHALREPVHGHAQPARGRARRQRQSRLERTDARLEVCAGRVHADLHVPFGDRGRRDSLPQKPRFRLGPPGQAVER
jgi:hypothetical protein